MKIKKIGLNNYGRFENSEMDLEFGKGLNVVFGKNEAGKSTLRNALSELLYGFQSKKAEKHPYYSNGNLELTGEYFDDRDEVITVQRTLDSQATGQKIIGSHISDIGNTSINEMNTVPFFLYKGLFEMDLADLIKLDNRKWTEVEEQISLQYGLSNMLTPQHVLNELEEEMHLLWRPHNRGKYKVKDIDEKLFELQDKRRVLNKTRKDFEGKRVRKKEIEVDIHDVLSKIEEKTEWLSGAEEQLHAFRTLNEVRAIETERALYNFSHVQLDEYNFLVRENEKQREEKSEIEKEIAELQLSKVKLNKLENSLLLSKDGDDFVKLSLHYRNSLDIYNESRDDLKRSRNHIENKSLELTSDPWNDALMNYWRILNTAELDKAIRKKTLFSYKSGLPWILILLGIAIAFAGSYYDDIKMLWGGGSVTLVSILGVLSSLGKKSFEFGEIQFNDGIWHSRNVFIEACDKMKQLSEGFNHKSDQVKSNRHLFKEHKNTLEKALSKYELGIGDELEESIKTVLQNIESAKAKDQELKLYQSKLSLVNDRKRKLGHSLMMNQQKLNVYKNELLKISDSTEKAIEKLEHLAASEIRRKSLLVQLEDFDVKNPELNEYRKFTDFDLRIDSVKTEKDKLQRKREDLRVELKSLEKDEERVFEDQRLDAIEAEIEKLESNRVNVLNEYNKLRMIHTIVSFADETFRRKYQPNLLKRASILLSYFTDNHYDVIVTSADGALQINDTKIGRFIPVHEHLSRGTLEQVYMAMRIAVAETIDKTDQKLPLVLDEVFVNWDHERLENALKALKEISRDRQVVYLTCHDWMAEKLSVNFGADKIDL